MATHGGYTFGAFKINPLVTIQIDMAYVDDLTVTPDFSVQTPVTAADAQKLFLDGLSPLSVDSDFEPLLMGVSSQDWELRNLPVTGGAYPVSAALSVVNRTQIRYRLSWDGGSNYEDIGVWEVDRASVEWTTPTTNVADMSVRFTAYSVLAMLTRYVTPQTLFGILTADKEQITTLYWDGTLIPAAYYSSLDYAVSLKDLLTRIASYCSATLDTTGYSDFVMLIGEGAGADTEVNMLKYVSGAWETAYLVWSASVGAFAEINGTLDDVKKLPTRNTFDQDNIILATLRRVCEHTGCYPWLKHTTTDGSYGRSLLMIPRFGGSEVTLAGSVLEEITAPAGLAPLSYRVTSVGVLGEQVGGRGDSEIALDCFFTTQPSTPPIGSYTKEQFSHYHPHILYHRYAANSYKAADGMKVDRGALLAFSVNGKKPTSPAKTMGMYYAGSPLSNRDDSYLSGAERGLWGKERVTIETTLNTLRHSDGATTAFKHLHPGSYVQYAPVSAGGTTFDCIVKSVEWDLKANTTKLVLVVRNY